MNLSYRKIVAISGTIRYRAHLFSTHTLTAVSVPLFHIHVLILEDQRQGMKISVQFGTMHWQWRQRGEISRSSCSLAHCLIRLIIRVVTTPRRCPGILQHEETFRETFHLFELIENNNLNTRFNISSKSSM